jgi:phage protein U
MADIGSMGDIIFTVSSRMTRTISDFNRMGDPRIATHEIIGKKPIIEYVGPGNEECSFTILLSKNLGINPIKDLNRLRDMRDNGEVFNVFLGGRPLSQNQWILKSMSESVNFFDRKGEIQSVQISVTILEYPKHIIAIGGVNGSDPNI